MTHKDVPHLLNNVYISNFKSNNTTQVQYTLIVHTASSPSLASQNQQGEHVWWHSWSESVVDVNSSLQADRHSEMLSATAG